MGSDILYVCPKCKERDYDILNSYICYIKSHCEAPDYEQYIDARDLDEAIDKFYSSGLARWYSKDDLKETHICLDKEEVGYICNTCNEVFDEPVEEEVNYNEEGGER